MDPSALLQLFAPAVLVVAVAGALRLVFLAPPPWLRAPLGLGFLALQAAYLTFRWNTLCVETLADRAVSGAFFAAELFIHLRIVFGNLSLLRQTDRSAQADASACLVRSGGFGPAVDVFVPTYSEPVEMLRRSLIGCLAMKYERKTVWLLDDQRRPAMEQLARQLGCRYLSRPDNRHAKAGNLNHALSRTQGEFVVCFDADFVPTTDFLERTLGFFVDPQVALVQTPQHFFNEDAPMRNLGLQRVMEDEQRFFFRSLQPGRDSMNAIVCHGTCFVVRRSALQEIGGIPTETLTEDWATSLKLQAAGYKLLYLNEALSAGVSAERCGEFLQQRSRWAQGTLQGLFAPTNPLIMRGLTLPQRLLHCSGILYYLGSVSHLFSLAAPLFYLFFGLHLLHANVGDLLFYRLPFMAGYLILFSWITGRTRTATWTEFYDSLLAPTIAATVVRSLCRPFARGFRVTDKASSRRKLSMNRQAAWPFVLLAALHIAGLLLAVAMGRHRDETELFTVITYFTLSNILTCWICCLVTFDVAQLDSVPRFPRVLSARLRGAGLDFSGTTVLLSEDEAVVQLPRTAATRALPAELRLDMPALEFGGVAVEVSLDERANLVACRFRELDLGQRRRLVEALYCQPGQWAFGRRPTGELRALFEYFRSAFRVYPLAESP